MSSDAALFEYHNGCTVAGPAPLAKHVGFSCITAIIRASNSESQCVSIGLRTSVRSNRGLGMILYLSCSTFRFGAALGDSCGFM